MEIKPTLGKHTVYASAYCKLDSNVELGGGTNETAIIQQILDQAKVWGRLHLVMDGAALISGIKVHSNTTIECMDKACGFFLEAGSDEHIIQNAEFSTTEYTTVNVTLKGGTYNHNGINQSMDVKEGHIFPIEESCNSCLTAFKFFGVKNFRMQDVTIVDQRRYALLMGNWEDVLMENIHIPLPHIVHASNQDGLHFHSPGKHLTLRNIWGRCGDDFIAINTDEGNKTESITDVTIDGLYMESATQGIRLLCRERGTLENVYINNVHGTVDSFCFYINPWFCDSEAYKTFPVYVQKSPDFDGYSGKFRNITIQNVNVEMRNPTYTYNQQSLFCIGGDIENIVIQNASAKSDQPNFRMVTVREGHASYQPQYTGISPTTVKNITVDGVYLTGADKTVAFQRPFAVEGMTEVENMTVKNVIAETAPTDNAFLTVDASAKVQELNVSHFRLTGFESAVAIDGSCEEKNEFDVKLK